MGEARKTAVALGPIGQAVNDAVPALEGARRDNTQSRYVRLVQH